jgi:hypothetical protein
MVNQSADRAFAVRSFRGSFLQRSARPARTQLAAHTAAGFGDHAAVRSAR